MMECADLRWVKVEDGSVEFDGNWALSGRLGFQESGRRWDWAGLLAPPNRWKMVSRGSGSHQEATMAFPGVLAIAGGEEGRELLLAEEEEGEGAEVGGGSGSGSGRGVGGVE